MLIRALFFLGTLLIANGVDKAVDRFAAGQNVAGCMWAFSAATNIAVLLYVLYRTRHPKR